MNDEGRPFGVCMRIPAPNHLELPRRKAEVVSVKEKSWQRIMAGEVQEDERKRTTYEVSKGSKG